MKANNPSTVQLPCACASFRRVSRALTQFYDEALRPTGLRATQFTLLQALALTGEITQGELGQLLAIDSTTLTRTLEIMSRHGWIEDRRGKDRRERLLRLSKTGQHQFDRALPLWEGVQTRLKQALGEDRWRSFFDVANELTRVVTHFDKEIGGSHGKS